MDARAAVSGFSPRLGLDWRGEAEGADRSCGVGDAKEIASTRGQFHTADRAGVCLEDLVAGMSKGKGAEEQQEARGQHAG